MEDTEENMSSDGSKKNDVQTGVKKPKKRSLVERELETSLTARVTSPACASDGLSTSRFGRARRLKTETDLIESQKALLASIKNKGNQSTPVKVQSPTYRMHASNSPQKVKTPVKPSTSNLDNQIDNIYQENASLSRFSENAATPSPVKKFPKVYTRKDLIQSREEDEPIMLISNLFSPKNSSTPSTPMTNIAQSNGHVDNSSVVKTLDFDNNKKKKDKETKPSLSKNELFEIEANCPYQVGDLAWARMGTFPFWPCIVTREPQTEMFVRRKLFGRVERNIIHVTFFGDNGRRSWIVDNMLRNYEGLLEFETTREKFTPEDRKKDPRLYAAFFISEKKQPLWNASVEEAEILLREPKRLRIDVFNEMLWQSRLSKKNPKNNRTMSRTNSDVSLSESLYDSLFSDQEANTDDTERSKKKSKNKSFDVSEVVTACLDNMAAKTGITKIQRQSHMDRWLQKAKSKTPEKNQIKNVPIKLDKPDTKGVDPKLQNKPKPTKLSKTITKVKTATASSTSEKPYKFRRRTESNPSMAQPIDINNLKSDETSSSSLISNAVTVDTTVANMNANKENQINESTPVISNNYDNDVAMQTSKGPKLQDSMKSEQNNTTKQSVEIQKETLKNYITKAADDDSQVKFDSDEEHKHTVESNTNEAPLKLTKEDVHSNMESYEESLIEGEPETINKNESNKIIPLNNVMDVDEDVNYEMQCNDTPDPKNLNVSNKSGKDNEIVMFNLGHDLQNTQNVTIQVSVTENDDTLIYPVQQVEKGNGDDQNPSHATKLDYESCQNTLTNMAQNNNEISDPKECSTPSKIQITSCKPQCNIAELNAEADNNIRKVLHMQNELNIPDQKPPHLEQKDNLDTIKNEEPTEELNESFQSVSILQCSTENTDSVHEDLNISINSSKSESILEHSENLSSLNSKEEFETSKNSSDEITSLVDKYQESESCKYVESPTYTQPLDSEYFFEHLEVNKGPIDQVELKESVNNNEKQDISSKSTNMKLVTDHCIKIITTQANSEIHKNECASGPAEISDDINSVEVPKVIDDDSDTSDEEPSPEYESLDDEIAEDFRKHMLSIESNIKDKKDEAQIVKICNEIAEKAKTTPKKHAVEEDIDNVLKCSISTKTDRQQHKTDKTQTQKRSKYVTKPKEEIRDSATHKITQAKKMVDSETEKLNIDNSRSVSVVTRRSSKGISPKTLKKLSPEIITQASKIGMNPSNEYEPTVLLTRLEKEPLESSENIKNNKPNKVKSRNDTINACDKQDKSEINHVNAGIISPDQGKDKKRFRLSLRRDSPKTSKIKETKNICNVSQVDKDTKLIASKLTATVTQNIEFSSTDAERPKKKESIPNVEHKLEHAAVNINGHDHAADRKCTDTPDSGDTDFDIDAVSLNSEDSEMSLRNAEPIPKRNLRSRPQWTLENALESPEFLKFLQVSQDSIMDEFPELSEDEVLSYVFSMWKYEKDSKSDLKKCDDSRSKLVTTVKGQETPRSTKKTKTQTKNNIQNYFRKKYETSRKIEFTSNDKELATENIDESKIATNHNPLPKIVMQLDLIENITSSQLLTKSETSVISQSLLKSPNPEKGAPECKSTLSKVDDTKNKSFVKSEEKVTPKRPRRTKTLTPKMINEEINLVKESKSENTIEKINLKTHLVDDEEIESPLRLRSNVTKDDVTTLEEQYKTEKVITSDKQEINSNNERHEESSETTSTVSENEPLVKKKKKRVEANSMEDPEFLKYLERKQDQVMDENPELKQDEIVSYLYKTWLYEEKSKSELVKNSELEQESLIKGFNNNEVLLKKAKRKPKSERPSEDSDGILKAKPRRHIPQPFYNENYSDIEDDVEMFEIKVENEKDKNVSSTATVQKSITEYVSHSIEKVQKSSNIQYTDETEIYFEQLTKPKPNVFKGLVREKVCEICEYAGHLVKCKCCHGMFHPDCVDKEAKRLELENGNKLSQKGRKKKIKRPGRKPKNPEESGSQSDERQDVSADLSMEEIVFPEITFDADKFESVISKKMQEILDMTDIYYDSYSSDDDIDWHHTEPGKCEIIEIKLKRRDAPVDYSDFKCNSCQKYDIPVCFVCKSAVSKTGLKLRQKCHVAHCHKHYHLECLDQWPQTQFNSGEPSKHNKKINQHFETLTCPRHVCHTCVSDDPRGCKTRFSGDKLAKCVRCPATYHAFNKCLPAGSQVLTASHIICPRHCDKKAGKVPCHVNTGWCFICALGGSLICCEYCPTSFHAECLNIKPPEGNYMCEDCETGRLPLYGEMVWVKLGHYRWWPGIILHPSEIPDNIMLVKHEPGDFVVRFFGQYDHYWVNRGRVFPYQEGDSGRISSQKSKINDDFICAIEHAQRAFEILKHAVPDDEESIDIESSLLPPHYVKLKCNKPCGSLCGKRIEDPSLSLTQCECNPDEPDPCGPYSQCLNRMLLTECGPTCRAGDRCLNRAFEKRQYPKLVPYRTPHRGWGLKTLEDIKAGQFVIEYVGELIDEEEFQRRMRRKHEIRDENYYFLTLDKERMIDAGPKGNVARFMNHCCEPNCETQKWTVLGDVRVGLFAINDIPANSEVTFNYNLECAGIEKKRCLCGAKRCSGYIGAKPKQDDTQTKKPKRPYNKKKKPELSPPTTKVKTKRLGRPLKPKELSELEKDVLIIKNASTTSITGESPENSPLVEDNNKALKRKRISEESVAKEECNTSKIEKRHKLLKIKLSPNKTEDRRASDGSNNKSEDKVEVDPKTVKEKRISNTNDRLSSKNHDSVEVKMEHNTKSFKSKKDISNGSPKSNSETQIKTKKLKRKRISNTTEDVTLHNGVEHGLKKQKCDESAVGD